MIPGEWEPRRRAEPAARGTSAASVNSPFVAQSGVSVQPHVGQSAHLGVQRPELPRWLQIVIFTSILLAFTVIAMWASQFQK